MIDLELGPEHRLVQGSAREFAAAEIVPNIREWDRTHHVDVPTFRKMGEAGFLGAPIPEHYGGSGMDYVSLGLLCEELERADSAFRGHVLAAAKVDVTFRSSTTSVRRARWKTAR